MCIYLELKRELNMNILTNRKSVFEVRMDSETEKDESGLWFVHVLDARNGEILKTYECFGNQRKALSTHQVIVDMMNVLLP